MKDILLPEVDISAEEYDQLFYEVTGDKRQEKYNDDKDIQKSTVESSNMDPTFDADRWVEEIFIKPRLPTPNEYRDFMIEIEFWRLKGWVGLYKSGIDTLCAVKRRLDNMNLTTISSGDFLSYSKYYALYSQHLKNI